MNGYAKPFWWTLGIVVLLIATLWTMQISKVTSIEARTTNLENQQGDIKTNIAVICQALHVEGCKR